MRVIPSGGWWSRILDNAASGAEHPCFARFSRVICGIFERIRVGVIITRVRFPSHAPARIPQMARRPSSRRDTTGHPRFISVLAAWPNRRIPWRSPRVQMPMKHLMRSRSFRSACLAVAFTAAALAILRAQTPEPLDWTAQQDHKNMMEQLGIIRLRPGPSGNANATNAANHDPAKANPFPDLPDPLVTKNGQKITTA